MDNEHQRAGEAKRWSGVLKKFLRASPTGIAIVTGMSCTIVVAIASFRLMMAPSWRWPALAADFGFYPNTPGVRPAAFVGCVISVWLLRACEKAWDNWVLNLRLPERVEPWEYEPPPWDWRVRQAAADIYVVAFWTIVVATGLLLLASAGGDTGFVPVSLRFASMLGNHLADAVGTIMREIIRLPKIFQFPAGLLVISFVFFGLGRLMQSIIRRARG